jgi:hypothetical protein
MYGVIDLSFTFLIKLFFSYARFSVEVSLISLQVLSEPCYALTSVSDLDLPNLNLRTKP